MKLTPIDIQQQRFRTRLFGVDAKEVDAFLDQVAAAFESLIVEVNRLTDALRAKDEQLEDHRQKEHALKDAMVTATKIAEDVKQAARKEAELVIAQAELESEKLVQNAYVRLAKVSDDIQELKRQRAQLESGLAAVLMAHNKLLDAMNERAREDEHADVDAIYLARRAKRGDANSVTSVSLSDEPQKRAQSSA